jgi:inorganic pyrophosphatase
MRAKPIGVMLMNDQGERDDKIICVHVDDPEYRHYDNIDQLPPHRIEEMRMYVNTVN